MRTPTAAPFDSVPATPARVTREYRPEDTEGEAGIDVPDHQPEQAENIHRNRQQEPVPCRELQ